MPTPPDRNSRGAEGGIWKSRILIHPAAVGGEFGGVDPFIGVDFAGSWKINF